MMPDAEGAPRSFTHCIQKQPEVFQIPREIA